MRIKASSGINSDANKLAQIINDISKDIKKIQDCIDAIPKCWKGTDSDSFVAKYNKSLIELKKYEKNLNNYYTFLTKVYDIFCTLDEKYGIPINTE